MKKIGNEVKTGLMVIACVLVLIWLTAKTSGVGTFKKGYGLKVQFNYVSGIKKGAPVQLTGVEVGEVKDVAIEYTGEGTKVMLSIWLENSARIRQDSKANITTMGLMGEKYLEITSGSKESPFLKEGSLIIGKEPMSMEDVMDKAMAITDTLNSGIGDLRKLTKDVDLTLTENRPQIDAILVNMNETSKNFKEFSDDLRRNPWKLLIKTKEKKDEGLKGRREKETRTGGGYIYKKENGND